MHHLKLEVGVVDWIPASDVPDIVLQSIQCLKHPVKYGTTCDGFVLVGRHASDTYAAFGVRSLSVMKNVGMILHNVAAPAIASIRATEAALTVRSVTAGSYTDGTSAGVDSKGGIILYFNASGDRDLYIFSTEDTKTGHVMKAEASTGAFPEMPNPFKAGYAFAAYACSSNSWSIPGKYQTLGSLVN